MALTGELLAFAAALTFGSANVAIAKAAKGGQGGDNGALLSIVLTAVFSGVLWTVTTPNVVTAGTLAQPWRGACYFMMAGVLATVFGRLALFEAIRLAGALRVSILRRTIPLFAAVLAYLVLGEMLSHAGLAGLLLIVASFAILFTDRPTQPDIGKKDSNSGRALIVGQLYGLTSALSYGSAFVTRKLGLFDLPDPALAALIEFDRRSCLGLCLRPIQEAI